ncbi:MAG: hypothetical protein ACI8TE_001653 [Francisella sp.]|jgi:hypothetical protein
MHIFISKGQREKLPNQHRTEKNGKIRDRIKSALQWYIYLYRALI